MPASQRTQDLRCGSNVEVTEASHRTWILDDLVDCLGVDSFEALSNRGDEVGILRDPLALCERLSEGRRRSDDLNLKTRSALLGFYVGVVHVLAISLRNLLLLG
jgi:hypothetical protein